jgi:site-specific recombinase XerD
MRDLYNRKARLNYWIDRIDKDLDDGNDKKDVLKFVEIMQEKDQSILTIIRCITAILQLRKQLGKPFSTVLRDDIKLLFRWMDSKRYKVETHEKYRAVLKKFYKMIYGNCERYPDCVSWFSVNVGKDKKSQERNIDINEFLEKEEVKTLIEAAPTIQKKAFLATCYETGARPEEHLRLSNFDCKIDTNGIVMILRGKTGERRVRMVSFAPLLQQWLEIHPLKDQNQFPLWISTATNNRNKPLGLKAGQSIIKEALHKAALNEKRSRLYILRHSRASHLCQFLTEAQMCVFFGWQHGTKVVRRYIHLSGKDLDNTLLSIGEGKPVIKEDNYSLKIFKCNRCSEILSETMRFCGRCGLSTNISEQYTKEKDLENENNQLKTEIASIRQEMNDKITMLMKSQKEILECLRYPEKLSMILKE